MPDLEQQPSLLLLDPNRKIWVIPLTDEELLELAEEVFSGINQGGPNLPKEITDISRKPRTG